MKDKHLNLGEQQMKLLEKIEELTLYAIQQEQADVRLREEAAGLREQAKAPQEEAAALRQKASARKSVSKPLRK